MEQDQTVKILTIDDEAWIRQSIHTYLEDFGYTVLEAADGREGLELVHAQSPDLVILDLRMPKMSGLEVLEILGQEAPDLPLIVVSGTGNMASVVEALRLGAWDYIFKPIEDLAVLSHSIEKCLKESRLKKENKAYQERLEELVRERSRELALSEQRYRAVFEYTGTAAAIIELDHTISMVNSRFCSLVGMPKADIVGKMKWQEFVSSSDAAAIVNLLARNRTKASDPAWQYEVRLLTASPDPRYADIRMVRIEGTDLKVASLVDLTEKKRTEKRWQELEKQLRKAQKMEAIGTLAGGIAHDLNNILSPVLGYADMIMRASEPESQVFQRSEKIQKAALRAADLVSQVLAFNRGGNEAKRVIQIHPVVREVVTLLKGSIPSTIRIKEEIDRNCAMVMADPTQIHQILMNLSTNAYHAMEEKGGTMTISLSQVGLELAQMMEFPNLIPSNGTYVKLEVTDTGVGMTEDILERIFDPYFTTKEEGKGTGLGLATVYSIVKGYQGDIHVKSVPGRGTTVTVLIPARQNPFEKEPQPVRHFGKPALFSQRLMVVDDDYDIAMMCKEGFESMGYQVAAFSSSLAALEYFKDHHETIDLVVTDQTMPDKTGIDLAKEMVAVKAGLPVVLCSGYAAAISKEKLEQAGIRRYIMKPVTVDTLSEEIQQILDPKEALIKA